MSNREIYYFSGTGNSLVVARDIAQSISAKIIPITTLMDNKTVRTDAQTVGFVFPVYDFKAPKIFDDLITKFKNLNSKYVFAITTYGIASYNTLKKFNTLLQTVGSELSSGFCIQMPHNAVGASIFNERDYQSMYKKWEERREIITKIILENKKTKLENDNIVQLITKFFHKGILFRMMPAVFSMFKQAILHGWQSLAFQANEKCNGCGTCEKVCPLNNIKIINNKPSWGDNCVSCFGCVQWCPNHAIVLGKENLGIKSYHHPQVKISDMIYKYGEQK